MKKEWQHKLLLFGFILVLWLPTVKMFFSEKNEMLAYENRKSASFPAFDIKGHSNIILSAARYFNDFMAYHADNFGFRNEMLDLFRYLKVSLLSVNPFPEKVVKGDNGFYFLGNSFSDVIKESKGISFFSESQLGVIANNIKRIDADCRRRGIKLYVAIAPNKHTVYGQCLPVIKSEHATKLEQVISRMDRNQIRIIDLKEDFHNYRDKRLFYLHDTHWNSFGGFLGYRTLMEKIVRDFPCIKVLSINDFKFGTLPSESNDLTRMLSMKIPEDRVVMEPKFECNAGREKCRLPIPGGYKRNPDEYEFRFVSHTRPLKALIFRDSFFEAMMPFIKESFGESVLIWSAYDKSLVDIEKPDLVIYELIEREIDVLEKSDP